MNSGIGSIVGGFNNINRNFSSGNSEEQEKANAIKMALLNTNQGFNRGSYNGGGKGKCPGGMNCNCCG